MFGKLSIPQLGEQLAAHQVCVCKLQFASFEHNSNCAFCSTIAPIGQGQIQASQNFVQHMSHHLVTKSYAVLQMQLWISSKVWIASVCERSIWNPAFTNNVVDALTLLNNSKYYGNPSLQQCDEPGAHVPVHYACCFLGLAHIDKQNNGCTYWSFNFGCSATRSRCLHHYAWDVGNLP